MAISRALFFVFVAVLLVNGTTVIGKSKPKPKPPKVGGSTGGKSPSKPPPSKPTPATPAANDTGEEEPAEGQGNPLGASKIWRNMLANYNIQVTPHVSAPEPSLALDCNWLCKERCKYSETGQCMAACQLCCNRCQCVPPGTSGNKEKCGKCYDEQAIIYGYKVTCP